MNWEGGNQLSSICQVFLFLGWDRCALSEYLFLVVLPLRQRKFRPTRLFRHARLSR